MNVRSLIDEMWELSGDLLNPHVEIVQGGERYGSRTGTLSSELSEDDISQKLGFSPERFGRVSGLEDKVRQSIKTNSVIHVDAGDSGIDDVIAHLADMDGMFDADYSRTNDGTFDVWGHLEDDSEFRLKVACSLYSPHKVSVRWRFKASVDGGPWHHCGIWDYKGARFSTGGEHEVFKALFGSHYTVQ